MPLVITCMCIHATANTLHNDYTLTRQQAHEIILTEILKKFNMHHAYTLGHQIPTELQNLIKMATHEILSSPDNFKTDTLWYGAERRYSKERVRQRSMSILHDYIMKETNYLLNRTINNPTLRKVIEEKVQEKLLNAITHNTSLCQFIGDDLQKSIQQFIHNLKTQTRYFYNDECPICMLPFQQDVGSAQESTIPVQLSCGHMACLTCLAHHCTAGKTCTCPECRQPLTLKTLLNKTFVDQH